MFDKILQSINVTVPAVSTGGTGYIDGVKVLYPAKGIDEAGRKFFSLPLKQIVVTEGETFADTETFEGTLTYFERYMNRPDLWVTGGQEDSLVGGAIKAKEAAFLEPLLERVIRGETVTVEVPREFHGWKKKTVTLSMPYACGYCGCSEPYVSENGDWHRCPSCGGC